jgi:hypothetical protein
LRGIEISERNFDPPHSREIKLGVIRRGQLCRPYCRLSLKFKPSSISRRTASERDGLSGCFCAQSSTRAINSVGARTGSTGAMPVAGRPRFFVARKLFLTLAIFRIRKLQADGELALATGPNPSHGVSHGSG